MHALGGADNRVHRAGLDALGAANADLLVDESDHGWRFAAIGGIERFRCAIEQRRERGYAIGAARRATIDIGGLARDCRGIRAAGWKTAVRALRLGQQRIDAVNEGRHGNGQSGRHQSSAQPPMIRRPDSENVPRARATARPCDRATRTAAGQDGLNRCGDERYCPKLTEADTGTVLIKLRPLDVAVITMTPLVPAE